MRRATAPPVLATSTARADGSGTATAAKPAAVTGPAA